MRNKVIGFLVLLIGPFAMPRAAAADTSATCLQVETGDEGTPIIRASINGARPLAFVLDTAASATMIDPAHADQLALPHDAETEQAQGLGGAVDVAFRRIKTLEAGPLRLVDIVAPSLPAPDFESHDIAGLAGIDLFAGRLAIWSPDSSCVEMRSGGVTLPKGRWQAVEANWLKPWKIMVPIRIGDVSGWGLLDTGAQFTTLNPAFADAVGLTNSTLRPSGSISGIDGQELPLREGEVREIVIGPWNWRVRRVRVGALPVFDRLAAAGDRLAILGIDWLAGQGFAIDYDRQVLWLRYQPMP